MKQINLQAAGVLDDLTQFRYANPEFLSNHARYFFIKFAIITKLWTNYLHF